MLQRNGGLTMMKHLRSEKILSILKNNNFVEVADLCKKFSVTEMTIRRDLDDLASKGLVVRTHGGAVLPKFCKMQEQPFDVRIASNLEEKEAIARKSLEYLVADEKIFMNSSSTVFWLARIIDNENAYLVATEATNIANELNTRKDISVIQIGGELRKNTISCVGSYTEEMIRRFTFDTAFIGINGIDVKGRLYCGSIQETGIYHAILESSRRVIVLADSTKIGKQDFAQFGTIAQIEILITDSKVNKEIKAKLEKLGLKIIVA